MELRDKRSYYLLSYYNIPYFCFSQLDHSNTGSGWASVFNTQRSRGTSSSFAKSRYRYFSLIDRKCQFHRKNRGRTRHSRLGQKETEAGGEMRI